MAKKRSVFRGWFGKTEDLSLRGRLRRKFEIQHAKKRSKITRSHLTPTTPHPITFQKVEDYEKKAVTRKAESNDPASPFPV